MLSKYARDLTAAAREGKLDPGGLLQLQAAQQSGLAASVETGQSYWLRGVLQPSCIFPAG